MASASCRYNFDTGIVKIEIRHVRDVSRRRHALFPTRGAMPRTVTMAALLLALLAMGDQASVG